MVTALLDLDGTVLIATNWWMHLLSFIVKITNMCQLPRKRHSLSECC
ncbi:hypothetical protein [Sneathiella limimaris]